MHRSVKTDGLPESNIMSQKETKTTQDWFDFSAVLDHIGQFGWWQKKIFLWLWIVPILNGLATLAYSFVAFVPQ